MTPWPKAQGGAFKGKSWRDLLAASPDSSVVSYLRWFLTTDPDAKPQYAKKNRENQAKARWVLGRIGLEDGHETEPRDPDISDEAEQAHDYATHGPYDPGPYDGETDDAF